jgi:uncharacterized FlaG/YvyC family protein
MVSTSLKDQADVRIECIKKIREKIDTTPKGVTIEYNKRRDNWMVQVSSGELSPYEMTASERMLPDAQRDDLRRRKKAYKKLMKRLEKAIRRRVDENIGQHITPFGQWPNLCHKLHKNKRKFNADLSKMEN